MGVTVGSALPEIILSKASERFTSLTQSGKEKAALLLLQALIFIVDSEKRGEV